MRVFVVSRDKTGLRSVNVFLEHEEDDILSAQALAVELAYDSATCFAEDLADAMHSFQDWFSSTPTTGRTGG